jgi:hypothetical protein
LSACRSSQRHTSHDSGRFTQTLANGHGGSTHDAPKQKDRDNVLAHILEKVFKCNERHKTRHARKQQAPMSIELLNMTGIADAWAMPYAHRASLRTTFEACDPEQRKYFF